MLKAVTLTKPQAKVFRQMFTPTNKGTRRIKCPFCKAVNKQDTAFCCDALRQTIRFLLLKCPKPTPKLLTN